MKVIVPVIDNEKSKHVIAEGFHNTDTLCIYDSDNNSFKWIETREISEKPGNLSLELKRNDIFTVISPQMPFMALGLFLESGLKVYRAFSKDLSENLEMFVRNELKPYMPFSNEYLSSCSSGSCGSCSSTSCN